MGIISILKLARYHFGYTGWLATDDNNITYWFESKPTFNPKLGIWIDDAEDILINYKLICDQTELVFPEYANALFKL